MIDCVPSNRVIVAAEQDTMSPAVMIQQAHTSSNHGDAETVYGSHGGAPDSVGGEGAATRTATICTDMMGGVVSVSL